MHSEYRQFGFLIFLIVLISVVIAAQDKVLPREATFGIVAKVGRTSTPTPSPFKHSAMR